MNNKETAVQYLEELLKVILYYLDEDELERIQEVIDEAKEIEKQQVIEAVDETNRKWRSKNAEVLLSGEQYYNEKYNN